jgi:hypothetical protein
MGCSARLLAAAAAAAALRSGVEGRDTCGVRVLAVTRAKGSSDVVRCADATPSAKPLFTGEDCSGEDATDGSDSTGLCGGDACCCLDSSATLPPPLPPPAGPGAHAVDLRTPLALPERATLEAMFGLLNVRQLDAAPIGWALQSDKGQRPDAPLDEAAHKADAHGSRSSTDGQHSSSILLLLCVLSAVRVLVCSAAVAAAAALLRLQAFRQVSQPTVPQTISGTPLKEELHGTSLRRWILCVVYARAVLGSTKVCRVSG